MNLFSILIIILFCYRVNVVETTDGKFFGPMASPDQKKYSEIWELWKELSNKVYNSVKDEHLAYNAWVSNYEKVDAHNIRFEEERELYEQSLNKFADREPHDIINTLQSPVHPIYFYKEMSPVTFLHQKVPENLNWVLEGWVSTYKAKTHYNQGWVFSAVKSVEAQIYKHTGVHKKLSRQQVLDCAWSSPYRSKITIDAFSYIQRKGVTNESVYELSKPRKMFCREKARHTRTSIRDFYLLQPENEENLKVALNIIGPISVSIKVTENFLFYKSGVFYDALCTDKKVSLNHAVLLVGYGRDHTGGHFWIIQNNWGNNWGEDGFARMGRRTLVNCGIASAGVFPVL